MARFASIESAAALLRDAGLSAADLGHTLDQARDALIFTRQLKNDDNVALATSKLGGAPDLAPDQPWPTRPAYADADRMIAETAKAFGPDGYAPNAECLTFLSDHWVNPAPLSFLGQINLTNMADSGPFEADLTPEGRLLVFVDCASYSVGAKPFDLGWIQVFHDKTPTQDLIRHDVPYALRTLQDTYRRVQRAFFDPAAPDAIQTEVLSPIPVISLPLETRRQPLALTHALYDLDLSDMPDIFAGSGPEGGSFFGDQLGGHPKAIQNDVVFDLFEAGQPHLRPVTFAEQNGRWDPYRWGHLLSIAGESYNPAFPSSWGDGDLYIGHRPAPAHRGGLGQVWAISQQT